MMLVLKPGEHRAIRQLTSTLLIIGALLPSSGCQQAQQQTGPLRKSTVLDPENLDQLMPVLVRKRANKPAHRSARGGGDLEWFSMEATGLGDLEEADAVRKMLRRSIELEGRLIRGQMGTNCSSSPDQQKQRRRLLSLYLKQLRESPPTRRLAKRNNELQAPSAAELRFLLAALRANKQVDQMRSERQSSKLLRLLHSGDYLRAIQESQRRLARFGKRSTDSENDFDIDNDQAAALFGFERRPSGAEEIGANLLKSEDDERELPLDDSLSSRISLLTMRKIQPEVESLVTRSMSSSERDLDGGGDDDGGENEEEDNLESGRGTEPLVVAASNRLQNTVRDPQEGASGTSANSANKNTNPNFLARIARNSYM